MCGARSPSCARTRARVRSRGTLTARHGPIRPIRRRRRCALRTRVRDTRRLPRRVERVWSSERNHVRILCATPTARRLCNRDPRAPIAAARGAVSAVTWHVLLYTRRRREYHEGIRGRVFICAVWMAVYRVPKAAAVLHRAWLHRSHARSGRVCAAQRAVLSCLFFRGGGRRPVTQRHSRGHAQTGRASVATAGCQ